MRKTIIALFLIFVLAACSSGGAPRIDPTLSTPEPGPTTLSVEDAGQVYLKAVKGSNAAQKKMGAFIESNTRTLSRLHKIAEEGVKGNETFLAALDDNIWPEKVQEDVDSLIVCVAEVIAWYDQTSRATDMDSLGEDYPYCGSGESSLIRARLHISSRKV